MGTVRTARAEDLNRVIELLEAARLPAEGVPEMLPGLRVMEGAGRVKGAIGLEVHGRFGLLRSAVVATEDRRRGYGAALTAAILEDARGRDLQAVFLLTSTAAAFFERFGFRDVAREEVPDEVRASSEFTALCPANATAMRIDLR